MDFNCSYSKYETHWSSILESGTLAYILAY